MNVDELVRTPAYRALDPDSRLALTQALGPNADVPASAVENEGTLRRWVRSHEADSVGWAQAAALICDRAHTTGGIDAPSESRLSVPADIISAMNTTDRESCFA